MTIKFCFGMKYCEDGRPGITVFRGKDDSMATDAEKAYPDPIGVPVDAAFRSALDQTMKAMGLEMMKYLAGYNLEVILNDPAKVTKEAA